MFANLPSLKALHAFEAAARHRSFSAAAAELSLTQGAISYQVKQLETNLGVELFHRRTRQVELSAAGQRLFVATHRLLRELDDEIREIAPARRETVLTVSVSTYFVTRWLSRRLGMFLNAHPEITLRLQHSVNNPDFSLQDVDLAIRWGDGRWSDGQAELLIEMPMIAVCAPALSAADPGIDQPRDLSRQVLLRDQPGMDRWEEWLRLAGLDPALAVGGPLIVDPNVRVQSAIDGHGLVLGNPLMRPEIEQGLLDEPFPHLRLEGYGYYLLYGAGATRFRAFRIFRQWLHDEARNFGEPMQAAQ